jgi:hypothetical protein
MYTVWSKTVSSVFFVSTGTLVDVTFSFLIFTLAGRPLGRTGYSLSHRIPNTQSTESSF